MIDAETLVEEFQIMYKGHWTYIWGHHEKGCVDCSGAFYYVFKIRYNLPMYNGSNRIARVYVNGELIPIDEARKTGRLLPGMAAFKCYKPGNANYNLKSGYKPGGAYYNGDVNDYHHIGLTDTNPEYVLNAQGAKTGFVRSKISENWSHVAFLKNVVYDRKDVKPMNDTMVVIRAADTSASTNTVNVRSAASTSGSILFTVKFDGVVQAIEQDGSWIKIKYGGKTGWMMSKFLQKQDEATPGEDADKITVNRVDLEAILVTVKGMLGVTDNA